MKTNNNHLVDKIVSGLRTTAVELEELQLQLVLGKAEAADKFEEVKKTLSDFIETTFGLLKNADNGAFLLRRKFEELQVQLALGKAESWDVFGERKKQFGKIAREIEDLLDSSDISLELRLKWNSELEKFKVMLEIFGLQFELGKMELKERVEKSKAAFSKTVEHLTAKFTEKQHSAEEVFEDFWGEAKSAYHDLKTAFTK